MNEGSQITTDQIRALSVDAKAALTAGGDVWTVPGIPSLGVPPLRMTDGPNGARGTKLLTGGVRSMALPCGSALAATWDAELVEQVGALIGREARQKRSRVLLAPTINLVRSPLYGRSFECYGEDPWLSGRLAAAFITGVQGEGVATTPKHLIGNETEFERHTIDSAIDERTLREVYLVPFEWAIRQGGALGVMTSYNRLNGTYCSEDSTLLDGILRGEWGFEGFVVSDWFAAGDTVASLEAGMDVQMPGPDRWFGAPVAAAVRAGQVDISRLDEIAERRVHVHRVLDAWHDDTELPEEGSESAPDRALAHRAAVAAITVVRNEGLLPLHPDVASVALIGPNAVSAHIMGGGSAQLAAHRRTTLASVFGQRLGERVQVEQGCVIDKIVPALRPDQGFEVEFFANDDWQGESAARSTIRSGRAIWTGEPAAGLGTDAFTARMAGHLTATEAGAHTFTLIQAGGARVLVDGVAVLDGIADPPPRGDAFFGLGSAEVSAEVELQAGQRVEVVVEFSAPPGTGIRGVAVGHRAPIPGDLFDRAVAAAADAEVAVVVVGTSSEWETEGVDRDSIDLPGDQDALVEAVCAANPNTVVVVNVGAPVHVPWAEQAAAVVVPWLGGQEMAPAVYDVLFGDAEPGGRLPVTFPLRIEHTPAYGNFPGESNRTLYGEGLLVGNRWYDTRGLAVRYPFGHGLSYTRFEWGEPCLESTGPLSAVVEVEVTNTGDRAGSDVVQLYLAAPPGRLFRPAKQLVGAAKVELEAGVTETVRFDVGPRTLAYWNPANLDHQVMQAKMAGAAAAIPAGGGGGGDDEAVEPGWYVDAGVHRLFLARSVANAVAHVDIEVAASAGPLTGHDTLPT